MNKHELINIKLVLKLLLIIQYKLILNIICSVIE